MAAALLRQGHLPKQCSTDAAFSGREKVSGPVRAGLACRQKQLTLHICKSSREVWVDDQYEEDSPNSSRRNLLIGLAAAASFFESSFLQPAQADDTSSLVPYTDDIDKFTISVPSDWIFGTGRVAGSNAFGGAPGTRRALAWFPEGNTDTNVTVVVTNVGADYTKMGSFGTAEQFGLNLVSSMDRSFLKKSAWTRNTEPVQEARLVSAAERRGQYIIEYQLKKPNEQERHLFSAVAMGYTGVYNRLYTVTAQCDEAKTAEFRPLLESILSSFQQPKPMYS